MKEPKLKNGQVIVLTQPRTFLALTDTGFQAITWPAGTIGQIVNEDKSDHGLMIQKGAFATSVARSKCRAATDDEALDFQISGAAPEPKEKPRPKPKQTPKPAPHIKPKEVPPPVAVLDRSHVEQLGLFVA